MKKANPAAVGAFVLGAAALLIVGVITLGSGTLFRKTQRFVVYPEGSVNGLTAGSPVKIRGVEIGTVVEVNALSDPSRNDILNQVIIEIDPARLKRRGSEQPTLERAEALVENGLRGRLELQSLVTGQLYVGFDFYPNQPVRLRGIESEYPELPMIPSLTQEIGNNLRAVMSRLQKIPLEEIAESLQGAMAGLDKLANSPDLAAAVAELDDAVAELRGAVGEARGTLADARKLVTDVDAQLDPLVDSAVHALDQAHRTLSTVESAVEPGADVRDELTQALEELTKAARAISRLADYLERNPSSIVFGRTSGEEK